jgi:hypothetical protein
LAELADEIGEQKKLKWVSNKFTAIPFMDSYLTSKMDFFARSYSIAVLIMSTSRVKK